MNPPKLADEDIDHFIRNGYVVVEDCFSPESAREWIDRAWVRLGYDRNDPSQWLEKRIHLSALASVDARAFAPLTSAFHPFRT